MALLGRARLGVLLLLSGCATGAAPRVEREGAVALRHAAPEGVSVWVVGDFNGWQPGPDPMTRRGDHCEAVLHLPPGLHAYAFAEGLPDGGVQIVTPEGAEQYVGDDLGGKNGLIRVSGAP